MFNIFSSFSFTMKSWNTIPTTNTQCLICASTHRILVRTSHIFSSQCLGLLKFLVSSSSTANLSLSLSLSLLILPLWSTGHPWNALFHFSFLILRQSVGLLGREISPTQGRYLHTGQHKHRINADRHPCLQWDSNPQSQCYSGRIQCMPYTARPLWSALLPMLVRKSFKKAISSS
jgi:hypothetical protein